MFGAYPRPTYLSSYYGPRGFEWLEPGLLAGCPQPGLLEEPRRDMEALARVGVKVLVTLTAEKEPARDIIEEFGMKSIYLPIDDQCAPTSEDALALCEDVVGHLKQGHPTSFHCRAGKGRTGTLLASMLIWHGMENEEAIRVTRRQNPVWIESEAQMEFLKNIRWNNEAALFE